MEENIYQSCHEPHPCGSDNEKTSTYSSKDGSSNYDPIFSGTIKSEYLQFDEHSQVHKTYEQKFDEINLSFKIEKSTSNREIESTGSKKRQLFKCPHCPKIFSNSSAIAKHKLTHSDERKYACDTCGKAFKRQDHLNGHKHTHKTNKPHACHLCDRSYSDARSLRRHYENQHQSEFIRCKEQNVRRDSGGSSVDESAGSVDVFGFLDEAKCIKCDVCNKGFKNQSALNGHMRLHGGYGQAKDCITGPGEVKPIVHFLSYSVDKTSAASSVSTSAPGRASNLMINTTNPTEVVHSQLHSLLTMVPTTSTITLQAVERDSLAHNDKTQGFENCLTTTISSAAMDTHKLQNLNMNELCRCISPSSNSTVHKLTSHNLEDSSVRKIPENIISTTIASSSTQHSHYSPITPAYVTNNNTNGANDTRMFNYPSIVNNQDITFDTVNHDEFQYNWDNTHSSYISSIGNTNEKPWSYFDSSLQIADVQGLKSTANQSFLPRQPSSTNIQDLIMNLDSIDPCNNLDMEWSKFSDDTVNIAESSDAQYITKKDVLNTMIGADCQIYTQQMGDSDNPPAASYKPSSITDTNVSGLHKKHKSRPGPIFIPPQTSAHMSRLRSPRVWNTTDGKEVKIPPYTPPPMLSPQRKGSGLFNSVWYGNCRQSGNLSSTIYPWNSSFSNNTITVMSNSYIHDSVVSSRSLSDSQISSVIAYSPAHDKIRPVSLSTDENHFNVTRRNGEPEHFLYQDECQPQSVDDADGLPTSATPRINIGPQYQAKLPEFSRDKRLLREDKRTWDLLLWDPKQFKDTVENISSLDLLMKIASSPAVKSCGLNMEYTFHLLCKFKGDLEKTLQALLEESFVVYDYVYAETTNWTTDEINKFQERLKKHDRDFMRVSLDLQSCGMNKSVKACVEFYYVWKQMNNVKDVNRFRIKSSRKKLVPINNHPLHDNDICSSNVDGLVVTHVPVDSGYNLRKKFPSGNQKVFMPYSSYEYRTSSDSSSREASPVDFKPSRTMSTVNIERMKKPQIHHCSQCKKRFAKSKTLENHLRSHKCSNVIRDKLLTR